MPYFLVLSDKAVGFSYFFHPMFISLFLIVVFRFNLVPMPPPVIFFKIFL